MPRIETYTSSERLTTQAPGVERSAEVAQLEGKQIEQIGQGVSGALLTYIDTKKRADNLRQETEAALAASPRLNQLKLNALKENNLDGAEQRYLSEYNKIGMETSGLISDKATRAKYLNNYFKTTKDDIFQIQKGLIQRNVEITAGARQTAYNLEKEKYATSANKGLVLQNMASMKREDVGAMLKTPVQISQELTKDIASAVAEDLQVRRNTAIERFADIQAENEIEGILDNVKNYPTLTENGSIEYRQANVEQENIIRGEAYKAIAGVYTKLYMNEDFDGAEAIVNKYKTQLTQDDQIALDEKIIKVKNSYDAEVKLSHDKNALSILEGYDRGEDISNAELETLYFLGQQNKKTGISKSGYEMLKNINKQIEKAQPISTPAQKVLAKDKLLYGVPEKFFEIDKNNDDKIDSGTRFEQIAMFRKALGEARDSGAITKGAYERRIKLFEESFQEGLESLTTQKFRNAKAVWRFSRDWFSNNYNFQLVEEEGGKKFTAKIDNDQYENIMAQVGNELMDYIETTNIKDEDIPLVIQNILGKILMKQIPEMAGKENAVNAMMKDDTFKNIYQGKSMVKPTYVIQSDNRPNYDPNTQQLLRNKKTGEFKVVPKEQA